jgi:toxin ParE1/3/4
MHVEWSALALEDRVTIFDYIESDNPPAANRLDDRIEAEIDRLAEFTEIGRPGRVAGTRELVLPRTPYLAVYSVAETSVTILRILHGAQQWPSEMPDRT